MAGRAPSFSPGFLRRAGEVAGGPLGGVTGRLCRPQRIFFTLFQKKSPNKSGGLDGWAVAELQQFPPRGWVGFTLVMRLAEAFGVWPAAVRMLCVASIAKHDSFRMHEDTRSIGISAVVYSVRFPLRFRPVSSWSNRIFPFSILGGVRGRSAEASRGKMKSSVCLSIDGSVLILWCLVCEGLGFPLHISRAAKGFYKNQVKVFKLGWASGHVNELCSSGM